LIRRGVEIGSDPNRFVVARERTAWDGDAPL